MPTAPTRRCSIHQCSAWAGPDGRCPAHPRPKRAGSTRADRRVAAATLASQPLCAWCGAVATEVDHTVPLSLGGLRTRANTQSLCQACHRVKSRDDKEQAWLPIAAAVPQQVDHSPLA